MDNAARKLPLVSENYSEKIWFAPEQIAALQATRRPLIIDSWGFVALLFLLATKLFFTFGLLGLSVLCVLGFSLVTVMVLTFLSIKQLESGRYNKSLRLCNVGLLVGKFTGTLWFAEALLDQVRAVALARQGRLVEAQIVYARWPASSSPALADTTLASIMSQGLRFKEAAVLYQRRYDQAQTEGDKRSMAIAATNLGFAHLLLDEPAISKKYSEEAMKLSSSSGNIELKTNILINLGRANVQLGELLEAEEQLTKVLKMTDERHKYMGQVLGEVQLGFAELRIFQNRLDEALLFATSATEYYQSTGNGEPLRRYALLVHVQILNALGRDAEALEITEKFDEQQWMLTNENEYLFERASETIATGKSRNLRRLTMGDYR